MKAGRLLIFAGGLLMVLGMGAGILLMVLPTPVQDVGRTFERLASVGRFEQAEQVLLDQLQNSPDDQEVHRLLGLFLIDRSDQPKDKEALRERGLRALEHLDTAESLAEEPDPVIALYQGKAYHWLDRWADKEEAMKHALEIDLTVPEAGWGLLSQYYVQGRTLEAYRLALRLFETEPDPRDRVQLLVELVRQDAQPPDPDSLVPLLEPVVAADPDDLQSSIALGKAMVRSGQIDAGIALLRETLEDHPDQLITWEGLLKGLELATQVELIEQVLSQVPAALADAPQFATYRARVAQENGEWDQAIEEYKRAIENDPIDPTIYSRLTLVLRRDDQASEADSVQTQSSDYSKGQTEVRDLYERLRSNVSVSDESERIELFREAASIRGQMLRPGEARAWYRLILELKPEDPEALGALAEFDQATPSLIVE